MAKLTTAQRKVLATIAEQGYIEEDRVKRPVRGALWDMGLIDYESISVIRQIQPTRMTMGRFNIDAYVFTEKGRAYWEANK